MNCPACNQPLVVLEFDNIEIDHCLSCGGIWLDAGELDLILHGTLDEREEKLLAEGTRGKRPCPMCRDKMDVAELPGSGVEVDFCSRQHGLWLDKGELQRIISAESPDERVGRLRDFCAKLFPPDTAGNVS